MWGRRTQDAECIEDFRGIAKCLKMLVGSNTFGRSAPKTLDDTMKKAFTPMTIKHLPIIQRALVSAGHLPDLYLKNQPGKD